MERDISRADVKKCVLEGEIIEDYPDDFPHPSCLIFGYTINDKIIHVVAGSDGKYIYIITAYFPNTIGFDKEPVNIDDIMETINHFQCFDYMIECANNTLDEEFIKNVHKILKTNTSDSRISWFNVGEYKSRRNMVGDMKTVPPEKVKDEMNK